MEGSETSRKTALKARCWGQPQAVMASPVGSLKSYGVGARIQYDVVRHGKWKCFLGIVFLVLDGLPFHLVSGVLLMEM